MLYERRFFQCESSSSLGSSILLEPLFHFLQAALLIQLLDSTNLQTYCKESRLDGLIF